MCNTPKTFSLYDNTDYFYKHISLKNYRYDNEISAKSLAINTSLLKGTFSLFLQNKGLFLHDRREFSNRFFIEHSKSIKIDGEIENFFIENEYDRYKIPVRLYSSIKNTDRLILFIHGGGWVYGNLDTHDYLCRKIVNELGCKVLAIDYRLAPEYKFPIGLEDVQSVYNWCLKKNDYLGHISEIYVSGDSSGGNLSAALNLNLRKKGLPSPKGLLLFYPVLSPNVGSKSFFLFGNQVTLTGMNFVLFVERYVGIKTSDFVGNELVFPINGDPVLFPKTFIVAAGCDVLLDGQLELFEKLAKNDVSIKLLVNNNTVHGFMTFGKEFDEDNAFILQKIKEWL